MIGEFGFSETVCGCFLPNNEALSQQTLEMLLQSVVAKPHFA